jgi:hypothetical protein
MSLEDKVSELTKAVEGLTKALEAQTKLLATQGGANEAAPKSTPKATPEKSAPVVKKGEAASTTSTATEDVSDKADEDTVNVTLSKLAQRFTDLVELNRAEAVRILGEFKVAKLGLAKPEQYHAIYEAVEAALNGNA